MAKIHYAVRSPSAHNSFPNEFSIGNLEKVLQESFESEGMIVVPEYFVKGSEAYPKNLAFFVLASYQLGNEEGSGRKLIAEAIATNERIGNFEFWYIDKFGVVPAHQGKGVGGCMLQIATQLIEPKKPAVLRTSIAKPSKFYSKYSDATTTEQTTDGNFYIHGFGFRDRTTGQELFEGAMKEFELAAGYVASKPRTVVPFNSVKSYK